MYFRWNFTGYTVSTSKFGSTTTAGDYLALIENGSLPAVLPPQTSQVYTVNTVSLATLLNPIFANAATHNDTVALGATLQTAINSQTTSFNANLATLQTNLQTVQTNLATVQTNLQASITSAVSPLQTGITSLTSQYNTLNSSLGTVQMIAYAGVVIAIIALLAAVFMSRRKSQ
jgi:hypothetical protein